MKNNFKQNKKNLLKSNFIMIAVLLFVLIFDILTKYIAEANIPLGEQADFLPGFINFVVVHNDGAAWNMFSGFQILLIILTILFVMLYLWFFLTRKSNSFLLCIASGLALGGSVGNLYDRIVFGYVRDFLNFQFFKFPVFNIADTALTIGVILLAIYFIFIFAKENKFQSQQNSEIKVQIDDLKKAKHQFDMKPLCHPSIPKEIEIEEKIDKEN